MRRLGFQSSLVVPLRARGEVLGAMALFSWDERRRYGEADLPLAEDVARRAAIAVDNALLYREAQTQMRNAEEASRAKDEFLATVSHELRTPLTSILGWTQILRAQRTVSPSKIERALQTIERNARAQAQLIEDLLDVSRISLGRVQLEWQPVDLAALLETAAGGIQPGAEAKGIGLTVRVPASVPRIMGDAARLQQVIWNLLTNAVKFTPRGGILAELRHSDAEIILTVTDTGQGIDPAFLPHVFDMFRQAEPTMTRSQGGLGIGLSLVRRLVELHGGKVSAASPGLGLGATFTVHLPCPPRALVPAQALTEQTHAV
jgi:signal transduction histidine kinase